MPIWSMTVTDQRDQDRIMEEARALLAAEQAAMAEADERNPVLPSLRTDPLRAANILLDRFFTKNGLRQLVYYRETWYSYFKQLWSERTDDDITHFLHGRLTSCRTVNGEGEVADFVTSRANVSEIMFQVQSQTTIPSHYKAPVALIDGRWMPQDASGKIVCRGQIVDMRTGHVDSNHHLFIPNGADWKWDHKAKKPKAWFNFLKELFGEDKPDEIQLLQEWMGYVLSGDMWAHKGMIMVGPPRAGKGTIGHVLTRLLGSSMVASPSLHSLGKDFGLEPLADKRLCLISDARLSSRADAMAVIEVLLRITAGDAVDVGRKYKKALNGVVLDTRVMMLSNEMPQLADNSEAINTRFLILQLSNSFLGREDRTLLDKLTDELPGIAHWCVDGYRRLCERGRFIEPESSVAARSEWYQENNPLSQFVEDRCVLDGEAKVDMAKLYEEYRTWSEARGLPPTSAANLSRRLSAMLGNKVRKGKTGSTRFMYGMSVNQGAI